MAHSKKVKKISLAIQGLNLKKEFPSSVLQIKRSNLFWDADFTPSAMSQTYTARLQYKLGKNPIINVLKPELVKPEGKHLPHTYPGERLCLYYPGVGDWRGDLLLIDTIVPWISEWLLHYEIWLFTNKWCGGGESPPLEPNG